MSSNCNFITLDNNVVDRCWTKSDNRQW